ncbi:MAG: Fic family protein [Acidimicrobiales bacterium]
MLELAGSEVPVVWRGRRVRAFVPLLLCERGFDLDPKTVGATATAAADVAYAAEALDPDYEPLARLLLRAEGVASSYIEGVRAPVADVVMAEQRAVAADPAAAWVAANLAALTAALTDALADADDAALSAERLCRWHSMLMTGSPLGRYVGVVRDEQGWIGGTDPTDAALVTPPPDTLPALVDDLVAYANRTDVDPITQAAIAHAQFEVVHPFTGGNGRIGRLLVAWLLTRRLSLVVPPPVSVAMAADVGAYFSQLALYRFGDHDHWIRWFAHAVRSGGRAQRSLIANVHGLAETWRSRLATRHRRTDAAAWKVLDLLPRHLVLSTELIETTLGITNKAANAALRELVAAGVLVVHGAAARTTGRPPRLYVCPELLALAGSNPMR